jgi:hypothetical protein
MTVEVVFIYLITSIVVFLLYLLVQYAIKLHKQSGTVKETMDNLPYKATFEEDAPLNLPPSLPSEVVKPRPESEPATTQDPVTEKVDLPEIPGQTEDELKEPEPLQQRVSQKVDEPSHFDKFEKNDNQALFGSNLRHPEAMIAATDGYSTLETDVVAGVASRVAVPETVNDMAYNAEMAQNGGEFMKGILAFDTSDSGSWFSSL